MLNSILVILCLIAVSASLPMSKISLAASRKIKPKLLADEDNINALRVLDIQESPGMFFTVVQIGLNAVVTLDGIVDDAVLSLAFHSLFSRYMSAELSGQLGFVLSSSLMTGMFILFTDLTPKHIGMTTPEAVALHIINPMRFCLYVCTPLVWFFNGLANIIFRIFKLPMVRKDDVTSDDIYAVVEAGALAGVLRKQEHELVENVFELKSRTVPSSVTPRESVIWLDLHENEQSLKNKVAGHPHSKFLICNEDIDYITGYVDSKGLLNRVLINQNLALSNDVQIRNTLIVPDALTLSEALESFKTVDEDLTVIMSEYALVMEIITLSDVMTTLVGDLVGQGLEEQIVARDENSWLIDGGTPIDDVMRVLNIDGFPQSGNHGIIGGFMMSMLRRIPKHTDPVKFAGYRFEVMDVDNYHIDQLLVTRIDSKATALSSKLPDAKDKKEDVA